ncbi:MAG: glycosyltransferase [Planctomycetes bacterium]|nr:glycosyltransferase [Planctomycetota bacterium]
MTVLYLCYQSLLDPLTQTQVVSYLEGLALSGYRIVLLTFEPRPLSAPESHEWRSHLAARGIAWDWCRYHRCPTVPATMWDILVGIWTGWRLLRRHQVRLIHARAHVPAVMGLVLKRLTGVKLLFDIRGFMGEEYVDAGVWPKNGWLFRLTKRVERALIKSADGVIVLTERAKSVLWHWYPREIGGKRLEVIPCCVDLRRKQIFPVSTDLYNDLQQCDAATNSGKKEARRVDRRQLRLTYVGKLHGWYLTEEMTRFVATAAKLVPGLSWQVWTQSDSARFKALVEEQSLGQCVSVGQVSADQLPEKLLQADVGLAFIKPSLSKLASSPTKIGEYLAAGLPVVANPGVGDVDGLLNNGREGPVGVFVRDFSEHAYSDAMRELIALLEDPGIRDRCRSVAHRELDLEHVGWKRYRQVYQTLLAPDDKRTCDKQTSRACL